MEGWVTFCFRYVNCGLASGLILGALLLLGPVTKRLCTPAQRIALWLTGWAGAYLPSTYYALSAIRILPYTFRDMITPRTGISPFPAYLPDQFFGEGRYNLALPGKIVVPVQLNSRFCMALVFLWVVGMAVVTLLIWRHSNQLRKRAMQGELLDPGDPLLQFSKENVEVWLCDDIPSSFVSSVFKPRIFLQRGLSQQRRELVLRHETNHIAMRHTAFKTWANIALVLYWWNPVVWLAYFQFCRDLELACDSRTLKQLEPAQRREYAKALVELGTGRQLWDAPLAFGECDAKLRVKAAVSWKPARRGQSVLGWGAAVLLLLFFVGGPVERQMLPEDAALLNQYRLQAWNQMVEDMPKFIREQEDLMPEGENIAHAWMMDDGSFSVWYEMDSGIWRKVEYVWKQSGQEEAFWRVERDGVWSKGPPLDGYDQIY